jgi:3',5'-cyclic AMP phosphodiesterase CpdA
MLPSIGNHDMGNREYFRHYFLHALWANSRRYYRRDWGNVRFVAMDGGIECREGCAQYAFVDSALEDAANKDMMVVMFLHYPPYSSGYHGSDEAVQGPIRALARTHGVELVVAGHDHDYERTKPMDGTTYIVSGSAGAPIRAVKPQPFSAALRTEPHYVLVDAESDRLTVRAVNLAGDVFDTYVIERTDPKR